MSRRTKVLLWLSTLPAVLVVCSAVGIIYYTSHLTRTGQATFFVTVHFPLPQLLAISSALFGCALISFFVDRRNAGKK